MIRRHFLAGVVGFKAMCAAAALAVGVGQAAEAATYDVIFTITKAAHSSVPDGDDEGFYTPLPEWWGIAVDNPVRGVLTIGSDAFVTLVVGGVGFFGGERYLTQMQNGSTSWWESDAVRFNFLTWTGSEGTWHRSEDHRPDYYDVYADIRLAPVPLPTTAALLPMGIGALAFLRKRRRLS